MKNLFLFFIAFALLGITACKRKTTETFYFSCYINGQYFEPEKPGGLGEYPLTAKLLYDGIDFRISASKGIKSLFLWVKDSINKIGVTQYQLFNTPSYFSRAVYDSDLDADDYRTDSLHSGIINISLIDNQNEIISGTFHFKAYNAIKKDTVHITDGKFKLKYQLH